MENINGTYFYNKIDEFFGVEMNTYPLYLIQVLLFTYMAVLVLKKLLGWRYSRYFVQFHVLDMFLIAVYVVSHFFLIAGKNTVMRILACTAARYALLNWFFLSIASQKRWFLHMNFHQILGVLFIVWIVVHGILVLVKKGIDVKNGKSFWTGNPWWDRRVPVGLIIMAILFIMGAFASKIPPFSLIRKKLYSWFYIVHITSCFLLLFLLPLHTGLEFILFMIPYAITILTVFSRWLSYVKMNVIETRKSQTGRIFSLSSMMLPGYSPGDYFYLYCPKLGRFERHPFTPVVVGNRTTFYIRGNQNTVCGHKNFTLKLYEQVEGTSEDSVLTQSLVGDGRGARLDHLNIYVSEPFPSQVRMYRDYPNVIFVSGGIGCTTSFGCCMDPILTEENKKVHLVMMMRTREEISFFMDLVNIVEKAPYKVQCHFICSSHAPAQTEGTPQTDDTIVDGIGEDGKGDEKFKSMNPRNDSTEFTDYIKDIINREMKGSPVAIVFCGPPKLGCKVQKQFLCMKDVAFFKESYSY